MMNCIANWRNAAVAKRSKRWRRPASMRYNSEGEPGESAGILERATRAAARPNARGGAAVREAGELLPVLL